MYILHDDKGNKIKYEGFGTSVPEEIMEVIGIKKIYLDSDESNTVNIGEQLEGPFLLSEKDSTKASAIGRLIGVNIIDEALREALKDLRDLDNDESNTVKRGEQLEGAYLLSEKDRNKDSEIGRLIGVNIIDEVIREALKDLQDFNNQKKVIDEKINELNNELKSYEYLDKLS